MTTCTHHSGENRSPGNKVEAIFLDRDGTINEEVGHLSSLAQLMLYPQAARAIKMINGSGMKSVVVTNQSGVARGYFTAAFVTGVHRQIQSMLAPHQAHLDAFYYCPHHPEGQGIYRQECYCRKPEPGMLLMAAQDMGIDLGRSYLIGDTRKDMQAGLKAGAKAVLVRTGYGREAEAECSDLGLNYVADDILAAVKWIMQDRQK
jgi:D-glycero-D-manno-heptose 1,7-bisphosphate phosphatase